jgi:uncharacterized protein YidB (DUF937 family)
MGLLDILNGMQNGPRGQSQPAPSGGSGGMSPIMMGLLALLAYKAIKGGGLENILGGGQPSRPAPMPGGSTNADGSGGLGDLLGGILGGGRPTGTPGGGGIGDLLGGLLGGGAAGSVLSSGLGNVLKDIQNSGHGRAAQSWVGTGRNEEIAPDDLAKALGADTIDALTAQTGLPRNELLAGLSQHLPELVDQLTPKGRLPTKEEVSRW